MFNYCVFYSCAGPVPLWLWIFVLFLVLATLGTLIYAGWAVWEWYKDQGERKRR